MSEGTVQQYPSTKKSMTWRGPWDTNASYDLNDVVSFAGAEYVAKGPTGGASTSDTSVWTVVVAPGSGGGGSSAGSVLLDPTLDQTVNIPNDGSTTHGKLSFTNTDGNGAILDLVSPVGLKVENGPTFLSSAPRFSYEASTVLSVDQYGFSVYQVTSSGSILPNSASIGLGVNTYDPITISAQGGGGIQVSTSSDTANNVTDPGIYFRNLYEAGVRYFVNFGAQIQLGAEKGVQLSGPVCLRTNYLGGNSYDYTASLNNNSAISQPSVLVVTGEFGNTTVTLPAIIPSSSANSNNGMVLYIKRGDSVVANSVTIVPTGTDTIEGATSWALSAQYSYVHLIAVGAGNTFVKWIVVGHS